MTLREREQEKVEETTSATEKPYDSGYNNQETRCRTPQGLTRDWIQPKENSKVTRIGDSKAWLNTQWAMNLPVTHIKEEKVPLTHILHFQLYQQVLIPAW